ncbi:MAG: polyphenol oxidase family protein [Candidatus Zixiibacteriota bacterium]|nr:MAG: polyphenol oxidase family protein [candidate division Zixibacteria bacterium]
MKIRRVACMDYVPVEKYARFGDIGFNAGIILKGLWNTQDHIYDKLESEISSSGKKIVAPPQSHGSNVAILDNSYNDKIKADGVLCGSGDCCLTVKTADCLPLLLADPETRFFGTVHIGWRGLAGGIIENLFLSIKNLDIDFDRLYISLGPSIGDCCFEVGGEVAVLFNDDTVTARNDRYFLNIKGLVKKRLLSLGVLSNNILDVDECTGCNADKYYSYRRDGHARIQMVSFICRK